MRKTAFFELFARRSAKSVRKQCFFSFFDALCTKFAKNANIVSFVYQKRIPSFEVLSVDDLLSLFCPQVDRRETNNSAESFMHHNSISFHLDGRKVHQCCICLYQTHVHQNLKTHLRVHSGEKPYRCTMCSYRATQQCTLKRHMMSHTH